MAQSVKASFVEPMLLLRLEELRQSQLSEHSHWKENTTTGFFPHGACRPAARSRRVSKDAPRRNEEIEHDPSV